MTKIINLKKKKHPFDFEAGENYTNKDSDPMSINSYYFSAHDSLKEESLYIRLAHRGNNISEVWFFYQKKNETFILSNNICPTEQSPILVIKNGDLWNISFSGELTYENKTISAQFEGTFHPLRKAIDFFSDMSSNATAKAMSYKKWDKAFFAETQANSQVHYEQEGKISGTLKIDKKKTEIDLCCVRDHSFGKRDWNYMNNHIWIMFVGEDSQLNFSMVSYPTMPLLEVGNFRENDDTKILDHADYDRNIFYSGKTPDNLELKLIFCDKTTKIIKCKKISENSYVFANGKYTLYEGIGDFEVDNKHYRGILEFGFNSNKERIFNGFELKDLIK